MTAEAPLGNEIAVRDNPEARRFEATIDGQVAFAEYNRLSTGIVLAHTEVPPALEGRGSRPRSSGPSSPPCGSGRKP